MNEFHCHFLMQLSSKATPAELSLSLHLSLCGCLSRLHQNRKTPHQIYTKIPWIYRQILDRRWLTHVRVCTYILAIWRVHDCTHKTRHAALTFFLFSFAWRCLCTNAVACILLHITKFDIKYLACVIEDVFRWNTWLSPFLNGSRDPRTVEGHHSCFCYREIAQCSKKKQQIRSLCNEHRKCALFSVSPHVKHCGRS